MASLPNDWAAPVEASLLSFSPVSVITRGKTAPMAIGPACMDGTVR
ncbi:hypothetical protein PF049_10010 [Erythrobacteraceae bacterium WH01K]|nr:hypothetical protein PF049_10010 [Erythrobacteraceae bacterium WH01K]